VVVRVRFPGALHVGVGPERNGEALLPLPYHPLPTRHSFCTTDDGEPLVGSPKRPRVERAGAHHCLLLLDIPRTFRDVPGTQATKALSVIDGLGDEKKCEKARACSRIPDKLEDLALDCGLNRENQAGLSLWLAMSCTVTAGWR
jgi:hypothetical protein